ncbi:serine/threonine protein kinase [Saccharopolyspora sp. K220]|uniref:serine/threonine-protein kinase n=1 Tax=Saccharopolyspora soli TaxID=2926618 RepID=UPI001F56BFC5|nr:serine/threonine-protein kinase [Saccharopolyspora soli]MCI2417903.1 serine/threonine protein kinase [Saccharopolyspora soli]
MRTGQLVIGRYRLEEQIGSGGNGIVWRATDEELNRPVAIKHALSRDSENGAERIKRLRREAKTLAQVNHPNVVTLFDVVADGTEWWLVMEYVPAPDLAAHGALPPGRVARLGAQLASALEAVHAMGIVHRDIKPGNVLVTDDDRAKLGDFGISRTVHTDVTLTDSALLTGTPGYVAPEVANGEEPTSASDVFSLGATLFAAVEGVSPFGSADNPLVLLRRAATGDIATPSRAGALAPALSALLRVDPAKRPTAAEAKQILENVASAPASDTGPSRAPRRRRFGMAATSVAVVAVLAIGAWLVFDLTSSSADDTARSGPSPTIGDPRTADPCALTDPLPLARFGDAEEDADYGNFNRCDVIVESGDSEVDVQVQLEKPTPGAPPGPVEKLGELGIVREPGDSDGCERMLLLPDRTRIPISAEQLGDGQADLCAMADTAVTSAVEVLSRGQIPRRATPEPASLINSDACALLDANALTRFPGVDAIHPEIGFGGWECRWESTTSPLSLLVRFDRNQPLNAHDGRPVQLAGHDAFVEPEGYGDDSCQVSVVHRQYAGEDAEPMAELLLVVVMGAQPPDQLCGLATGLAEPAAAALPRP